MSTDESTGNKTFALVVLGLCITLIISVVWAEYKLGWLTSKLKVSTHTELVVPEKQLEFCHNGIKYIEFGIGNSIWGTVMYDSEGKAVHCTELQKDKL
jgi:hypothetical protein